MKIDSFWGKIIGAVVTALLAAFQLDGPLAEIIQQILDSLLGNLSATGLGAVSVGLVGSALKNASNVPKWQRDAVEAGAGQFCPTTGKFVWKCDEEKAGE